jgi:hypothetical protein
VLSQPATTLFALAIFFRLARGEPFGSMLLNQGRTKRLAAANLSSISALVFATALLLVFHDFAAVMAGRLLGELTATAVTLFLTRELMRRARLDYFKGMAVGLLALGAVIPFGAVGVGVALIPSLAAAAVGFAVIVLWALSFTPGLLEAGFTTFRFKA